MRGPVTWELEGAAGQSLGAFLAPGATVVLTGQANDYVGKGLSGGVLVVRPEPELLATARDHAVVGNTCLYGATGGRLHVVGRAAMRFAVRNSGAEAVVEGIGPHGCAYMTGGTVVILGTAGGNLGAGMTGGRVFLDDSSGGASARVDAASVRVERLASVRHRRDAPELFADLLRLLRAHADAGSSAAREMLSDERSLGERVLLIESLSEPSPGEDRPGDDPVPAAATAERRERGRHAFAPTPAA